MVSLEWPSTTLLVAETMSGNRPSVSSKIVFTFGHWEVGKGTFCSPRSHASSRWIHARRAASPHQESGLCASRETEKKEAPRRPRMFLRWVDGKGSGGRCLDRASRYRQAFCRLLSAKQFTKELEGLMGRAVLSSTER